MAEENADNCVKGHVSGTRERTRLPQCVKSLLDTRQAMGSVSYQTALAVPSPVTAVQSLQYWRGSTCQSCDYVFQGTEERGFWGKTFVQTQNYQEDLQTMTKELKDCLNSYETEKRARPPHHDKGSARESHLEASEPPGLLSLCKH